MLPWEEETQRILRERAEQVGAAHQIEGRAGLAKFSINEIGLFGLGVSRDLQELRKRMEERPGDEGDLLRKEQLEATMKDVTDEMKVRTPTRGRSR